MAASEAGSGRCNLVCLCVFVRAIGIDLVRFFADMKTSLILFVLLLSD